MYRSWHSIPFLLLLALLVSRSGYPQDKPHELRVVMDLEKSHSQENQPRVLGFGASCKSVKKNDKESGSYHPGSDEPISIAEWMGAPVEVVKVRRYGHRGAAFLIANAFVQNDPDQLTEAMRNGPMVLLCPRRGTKRR
jgi:hypothetical protein